LLRVLRFIDALINNLAAVTTLDYAISLLAAAEPPVNSEPVSESGPARLNLTVLLLRRFLYARSNSSFSISLKLLHKFSGGARIVRTRSCDVHVFHQAVQPARRDQADAQINKIEVNSMPTASGQDSENFLAKLQSFLQQLCVILDIFSVSEVLGRNPQ
jgi:hypothetical protein